MASGQPTEAAAAASQGKKRFYVYAAIQESSAWPSRCALDGAGCREGTSAGRWSPHAAAAEDPSQERDVSLAPPAFGPFLVVSTWLSETGAVDFEFTSLWAPQTDLRTVWEHDRPDDLFSYHLVVVYDPTFRQILPLSLNQAIHTDVRMVSRRCENSGRQHCMLVPAASAPGRDPTAQPAGSEAGDEHRLKHEEPPLSRDLVPQYLADVLAMPATCASLPSLPLLATRRPRIPRRAAGDGNLVYKDWLTAVQGNVREPNRSLYRRTSGLKSRCRLQRKQPSNVRETRKFADRRSWVPTGWRTSRPGCLGCSGGGSSFSGRLRLQRTVPPTTSSTLRFRRGRAPARAWRLSFCELCWRRLSPRRQGCLQDPAGRQLFSFAREAPMAAEPQQSRRPPLAARCRWPRQRRRWTRQPRGTASAERRTSASAAGQVPAAAARGSGGLAAEDATNATEAAEDKARRAINPWHSGASRQEKREALFTRTRGGGAPSSCRKTDVDG